MDSLEKWVSLSDICDHLNLSRDTVKKMVKQQNMPGYKVDRQWRFKISEVDAWIRSKHLCEKSFRNSNNRKSPKTL